jgi:aminoglycoside phosphotransferase (APT) family kinase protein
MESNQNGRICSIIRGPIVDRRAMGAVKAGPFESEEEFNAWQLDPGISLFNRDMYQAMHKTNHKVVLSHGDLGFHNVIVRDGHVVAIIDWEDSGLVS